MVVLKNKALLSITLAVLMAAGLLVAGLMALVEPAEAAFPGQNGKIAFTSARDNNDEIYTMNTTGGALDRLTNNPQSDEEPAWSPDGNRTAFASNRDGNFEIYTIPSTPLAEHWIASPTILRPTLGPTGLRTATR
jgi:hypothetical protein